MSASGTLDQPAPAGRRRLALPPAAVTLLGLPAKVVRRLRDRGLADTLDWAGYQLSWRYREWRLGIETTGFIPWYELGEDPDHQSYEPIDFRCFDIVLDYLGVRPGQGVALDYGSGKGRAVVLAAARGFRRVIGVERSAELCAIAEENLRRARGALRCQDVEIVHADAETYRVPDDVTTVLLFNPFTGPVLLAVLAQIRRSLLAAPRPLRLIYLLPKDDRDLLAACDWLVEERVLPTGFWPHVRCIVYRAALGPEAPARVSSA